MVALLHNETVYIAGRITSDSNARRHFAAAERHLRARGFLNIINPAELDTVLGDARTYGECLKIDLALILVVVNRMYMLKKWELSLGATAEHSVAKAIGLDIEYEDAS